MGTIAIHRIKEDEFILKDYNLESIDSNKMFLSHDFKFEWELEKKLFTIKYTVRYAYEDKKEYLELIKFSGTFTFCVSDLERVLILDDQGFDIPDELLLLMVSSCVSTTRGMLIPKISGTVLSRFYLPMIDARDLMKEYLTDDDELEKIEKKPQKKALKEAL